MTETTYNVLKPENGAPIKAWTKGVQLEDAARQQLLNVAQLPFIYKWVAAMPDVHWGIGATVGSVIPTRGAIIPAAVGVDTRSNCGMSLLCRAEVQSIPEVDDARSCSSHPLKSQH